MFVGVRRLALAVGMVLLLGVTACGSGGSRPRTLPPLSATPVVSTTTPAPGLAAKTAKAEAEHVVREYFRLINNLSQDMDYRSVAALMTPGCSCRAQVEAIRRAAMKHQHFVDTARHLALTAAADSSTIVEVLARYDTTPGGIVDGNGRTVTSVPAKDGVQRLFRLRQSDGAWRIYEIQSA